MKPRTDIPEYMDNPDLLEPVWVSTWNYIIPKLPYLLGILALAFLVSIANAKFFLPVAITLSLLYLFRLSLTGEGLYSSVKNHTIWLARYQARQIGINMQETVAQACRQANLSGQEPHHGPGGPFLTPRQLGPLALDLLRYPPELGAFMVTRCIPKMHAKHFGLQAGTPETLAADLMMTFERLDLIAPQRAEKVTHFLARAIMLHRNIRVAKQVLHDLGRCSLPELPSEEMAVANPPIRERVLQVLFGLVEPLARKMA